MKMTNWRKMKVQLKQVKNNAIVPEYQTIDSAGVDLHAAIDESIEVKPGERKLIPTGIALAIPTGFEAQIRSRSGLAFKHGVTVLNSPGTIDADYRGEIGVVLINQSNVLFVVKPQMRIAQMVFAKVEQAEFDIVTKLSETNRGAGGFGSTG